MNKLIKYLTILLITALAPYGANAQLSLLQQFGFGGENGFSAPRSMLYGSDGYIYLMSTATTDGISGNINVPAYGNAYLVLTKLNANYDVIWQNSYGGNGWDSNALIYELSDGLLIASSSSSGISGNKTVDTFGGEDGWVFKLDFDGNILWQQGFGGNAIDRLMDVVVTSTEEIYLGFRSQSSASGNRTAPLKGNRDYWIVKLDNQGDILWDYSYGSDGDDAIRGIALLDNGNIVASGTCQGGTISFDKTEPPFSFSDSWLVCIDTGGTVLWDKTIGGDIGELDGFLTSKENSVYLLSSSISDVSGLRTEPRKGTQDLWVSKLDENGSIVWMNFFGGDNSERATSIDVHENMLFISAYSSSNISFDKTEDSRGGQDYWMIVTDLEGEIIAEKTIGGALSDLPQQISFIGNRVLIMGTSYSDISGDKTIPKFNSDPSFYDSWIVELDASTLEIIQTVDVQPSVYPNPVTDYLTINLSEFSSVNKVDVFDYQGKLLLSSDLSNTPNPTTMQIDMSGFSSGMYTVRVYGDNVVRAVKVVK